MNGLEAFV